MQLEQWAFIRRFAMHIIPHRFVRIRHYGILSNRSKGEALLAARVALGTDAAPVAKQPKKTFNPLLPNHYCTCCRSTTPHLLLEVLPPARARPMAKTLRELCKAVF